MVLPVEGETDADGSFSVAVEPQPKLSDAERGGATRRDYRAYNLKRKAKAAESADNSATVILLILDGLVRSAFGDECAMTEGERKMIYPPLSRILQRLDASTVKLVEKWTDPIMLTMGMTAWLGRIYRIQSTDAGDDSGGDDTEPELPPRSPNGTERQVEAAKEKDNTAAFRDPIVESIGGDRLDLG